MVSAKLWKYILLIQIVIFCSCAARKTVTTPITNRNLDSGNVLCVFAHQDDDAFIISRLKSHSDSGDSIKVVYTVFYSHKRERYSQKRISESKSALQTINVNSEVFLGYPDTKTFLYVNEIILRLDSVISRFKPKVIYVPAYEGGNIDHDIANYCVAQFRNKGIKIIEFPLYSAYKTILIPFLHRNYPETLGTIVYPLNKSQYSFVKDYWGNYHSQKLRFEVYLRLASSFKHVFGYEYVRELPQYNYTQLPPTKHIAYKRYTKAKFSDFENGINKATVQ